MHSTYYVCIHHREYCRQHMRTLSVHILKMTEVITCLQYWNNSNKYVLTPFRDRSRGGHSNVGMLDFIEMLNTGLNSVVPM